MPVVSVPALAHSQATAETLSLCNKIRFTPPPCFAPVEYKANLSVKTFWALKLTRMCHPVYAFVTFADPSGPANHRWFFVLSYPYPLLAHHGARKSTLWALHDMTEHLAR